MLSFDELTLREDSPVYLQIVGFVCRGVAAGRIRDGEELPSRRVLSALLGVNPNTVQKAFRTLEEQGVVESRAGAKSCVRADEGQVRRLRAQLAEEEMRAAVTRLRQMGVQREEALAHMARLWEACERGEET